MHQSVYNFVRDVAVPSIRPMEGLRVLEVGSLDVNGTVRDLFEGCDEYIGIDIQRGPGVDAVCSSHNMRVLARPIGTEVWGVWDGAFVEVVKSDYFDVLVSTEVLEHDPAFWESFAQYNRVLKPGGWLIVTCRGIDFPKHDYPSDYYRFTTSALEYLFQVFGFDAVVIEEDSQCSGVLALGTKSY